MKLNEAEMASLYGGYDEMKSFFHTDDKCTATDACTCYPGQTQAKEKLREKMHTWDASFE